MSPDTDFVAPLSQRLLALNMNISTAESCTGGGIGYCLTALPGSSTWYLGGYISYSNQAKIRDLGVKLQTLDSYGAVSEEVACQMAEGCASRTGSDLGISVTGIAGPDGGTDKKPVGTVCFGWSIRDTCLTETRVFAGDRSMVRQQTIEHALLRAVNLLDDFSV